MVVSAADDFDFKLGPSPSHMIKQFYTCINEKKLKELDGYISDDCFFEDCSFLQPMQGKKVPSYSSLDFVLYLTNIFLDSSYQESL